MDGGPMATCPVGCLIRNTVTTAAWMYLFMDNKNMIKKVGGGQNAPGIHGACATRSFAYPVRSPLIQAIMVNTSLLIIWTMRP